MNERHGCKLQLFGQPLGTNRLEPVSRCQRTESDRAKSVQALLSAWLEPEVGVAADYPMSDVALYPEEIDSISAAIPARRSEFCAGRVLARRALAKIAGPQIAIPVGTFAAPEWPSGYVGAISHDGGVVAAVAGHRARVIGVGIDLADVSHSFDSNLVRHFATAEEYDDALHFVGSLAPLILFSAKETVIKIISPILRSLLDPLEIAISLGRGSFVAHPSYCQGPIHGRWERVSGIVVTAARVFRTA